MLQKERKKTLTIITSPFLQYSVIRILPSDSTLCFKPRILTRAYLASRGLDSRSDRPGVRETASHSACLPLLELRHFGHPKPLVNEKPSCMYCKITDGGRAGTRGHNAMCYETIFRA